MSSGSQALACHDLLATAPWGPTGASVGQLVQQHSTAEEIKGISEPGNTFYPTLSVDIRWTQDQGVWSLLMPTI